MSRICCARCRATFVLSQEEIRARLSFCPSCGNAIQLWLTPETPRFRSNIEERDKIHSHSTLQFTKQDVVDVFVWKEVERYRDHYATTEQAIWEWASGNAGGSGTNHLMNVQQLMGLAVEGLPRARDLIKSAELICWDSEEHGEDIITLANAPVVRILFGRNKCYATLKKKTSSADLPGVDHESTIGDPTDEFHIDEYGFHVKKDGMAFLLGYGWMDPAEANFQRKLIDAQNGMPWDD